ncbi:MAG TPA: hypothetical protein PKA27_09460 [Fimbriimonadaceae bacterium]|nr:hypothetical protein [Fimbriimonadaceae bacterium]
MKSEPNLTPSAKRRRISPWWSAAFLASLFLLYGFRPDSAFAITVWPAWLGAGFGFLLSVFSRRLRGALCLLWAVFVGVFVDEAKSLPRAILPAEMGQFRVVTLNCAGGSESAAREVARLKPDLVLFQESPSEVALRRIAKEVFGEEASVHHGIDASIIAKGRLEKVQEPRGVSDFVAARWIPATGRSLQVVSLRLLPPVMRIDLYNPAAWSDFTTNRRARRDEAITMATNFETIGIEPDLIGGDFNTPPDRSVLGAIVGSMDDVFAVAGVGLAATCVNPYPCIVRIDQIWAGTVVRPVRAWVERTENSDHRMLVADFRWR